MDLLASKCVAIVRCAQFSKLLLALGLTNLLVHKDTHLLVHAVLFHLLLDLLIYQLFLLQQAIRFF